VMKDKLNYIFLLSLVLIAFLQEVLVVSFVLLIIVSWGNYKKVYIFTKYTIDRFEIINIEVVLSYFIFWYFSEKLFTLENGFFTKEIAILLLVTIYSLFMVRVRKVN